MDSFLASVVKPFESKYEQYDILQHVTDVDSPAVAAVRRLHSEESKARFNMENDKDVASMASVAISRNRNLVHDVASQRELKKIVEKPSEYVNGKHIHTIREEHTTNSITPSPRTKHPKAIARSYRNSLHHNYTRDMLNNDGDKKPQYDWMKGVRQECIKCILNVL